MGQVKRSGYQRPFGGVLRIFRWFTPGLGVKRWMVVLLLGMTLLSVGLAILVLDVYRTAPDTWWLPFLSAASLRFFPRPIRVLIFGGIGVGLFLFGIWGLNRSLLAPFLRPGRPVVDALALHRRKGRGPRIVTIGGGHGLATLLRGLKTHTHRLTAVVTVSDDGGSSGRLRQTMGMLPPGDIRNCLAALSNDEALLTQLFQYRFANGNDALDGHSFGNLFISALMEITGSFEDAIAESGQVLSVHGRVLPATLHDTRLVADVVLPGKVKKVRIEGESRIPAAAGKVNRVWIEPGNPPAFPQVIQAILSADLIVIGPGSLYTSILPNLLVPDIIAAVRASHALKIMVCNVATQPGETDGYSCDDHVRVLEEHVGSNLIDIVLTNQLCEGELPEKVDWVLASDDLDSQYAVYRADIVDCERPWRHNPERLAQVLIDLLRERTGPLVE